MGGRLQGREACKIEGCRVEGYRVEGCKIDGRRGGRLQDRRL